MTNGMYICWLPILRREGLREIRSWKCEWTCLVGIKTSLLTEVQTSSALVERMALTYIPRGVGYYTAASHELYTAIQCVEGFTKGSAHRLNSVDATIGGWRLPGTLEGTCEYKSGLLRWLSRDFAAGARSGGEGRGWTGNPRDWKLEGS